MLFILRTTLGRNLGGMGELRMYKHSHIGTKRLIERYIESVQKTLVAVIEVSDKQGDQCPVDLDHLVDQMRYIRQYFGRSALLLSGGGTFGMNHIGVVKCLWDQKLLPRLISGASAGSIVCAVLCSKTDEEIPQVMHEFCYGDLDVFERNGQPEGMLVKIVRMFQEGGLFDISHLKRVMQGILGDMTFLQAYNRTHRILNIPVSTSSHFELPRLLNYVTAPNVVIWSAVCTSCSVPLVYKKATLLAKNPRTNELEPWDSNPDATWIDGSVDNDLPMTRLAEMFNVNHFIVSQVNPHVVPFLTKEEELVPAGLHNPTAFTPGPGWFSNGLNLARGELVHRMQVLVDMNVLPNIVTKLRSVLSQRYSGDINIFPQISLVDFPRVLTNPTPEFMYGCMLTGQRATWPRLARIENHVKIELAIDHAVHQVLARQHFSSSDAALRLNSFGRPNSHGNDMSDSQRSKSSHKLSVRTAPSSPVLRKSAPSTPWLPRPTVKIPDQSPEKNAPTLCIASPSTNAEDSSDRDYFAEVDSDTTDILSSPSPLTSPSTHEATWSSLPSQVPHLFTPRPPTPPAASASASFDRRQAALVNLSMTSAASNKPSSAEARYKSLFHPPGVTQLDTNVNMSIDPDRTPVSRSRRSSLHDQSYSLPTPTDRSGTRAMLMRKKSFGKPPDDAVE